MTDIYCGIGKVPKKQRRGTPEECVEKGQIRYYGLKQIDQRLIDNAKNKAKIPVTRDKLVIEIAKERGNINRYKGRYEKAPKSLDKKTVEEYHKLWKASEKRYAKLVEQFKKLEKKEQNDAKKKTRSKSSKKTK